jgi:alpha-galactosidase
MPQTVTVGDDGKLFQLGTDHLSYIFRVLANGELEHLYFGPRIHDLDRVPEVFAHEERKVTPTWDVQGEKVQPELLAFEYPAVGHGDFRTPAYEIAQTNGSRTSEFRYDGFRIDPGKHRLNGLPSSFDDDGDDAQTLVVSLRDQLIDCVIELRYTVFPHEDVLVRSTKVTNLGQSPVTVESSASLSLDLPDSTYDFIQLSGAWARENRLFRSRLHSGIQEIHSTRGASSHQHNPFLMLASPTTTERTGTVIGVNLIYSGNFRDRIEVDHYGTTRLQVGIHPDGFAWTLDPQASFQTPEAVLSMGLEGFNSLSENLSTFITRHVVNPRFSHSPRPIVINNWEATYFDFDQPKLLDIATRAKDLGIELFVLDDGWFGHRDDATTSLGDWVPYSAKLPDGVDGLSKDIHDLGLQFGLWFEPEMVSMDSHLQRTHPDWLIGAPGRSLTMQRSQYVLDMSNSKVVDYLYDEMASLIRSARIDYIKWDMNRNITEAFGRTLPAERQGEFLHRYILGVYDLYARLTTEFPDVLFESCASGGGRFDLGMMYYAPQAWTSDDTDAVERALTQFATSYGYPQSTMGAHVSEVPNHETGRVTSLDTRGNIAFFGDLGYELDISTADEEDLDGIGRQIGWYKRYRSLLQYGKLSRLISPYEGDGNTMAWQIAAPDGSVTIMSCLNILSRPNPPVQRIRLADLEPTGQYAISGKEGIYFGDELMNVGVPIPQAFNPITHKGSGDFTTHLLVIERLNQGDHISRARKQPQ